MKSQTSPTLSNAAGNPAGHSARLVPMAEACRSKHFANEITLTISALIDPIHLYCVRFSETDSTKRSLSDGEAYPGKWGMAMA